MLAGYFLGLDSEPERLNSFSCRQALALEQEFVFLQLIAFIQQCSVAALTITRCRWLSLPGPFVRFNKERLREMTNSVVARSKAVCVLLMTSFCAGCGPTVQTVPGPVQMGGCPDAHTDGSELVPGCNKFGIELLKSIDSSKQQKNIVLSGYSIAEALNMLASGAEGATAREVYDAIDGSKLSGRDVEAAAGLLRKALHSSASSDKAVQISIANSVWINENEGIKRSYIETCKEHFSALVRSVRFGTEDAVREINKWIAKATRGKISYIVETLDPSTKAVLVNAVYFKGEWSAPFPKILTEDEQFHISNVVSKTVKMMEKCGALKYDDTGDAQMVALPYGRGQMRMLVVLPASTIDAGAFLAKLNGDNLAAMERNLSSRRIDLFLPRFKVELGTYTLNHDLEGMGIRKIFGGGDFSKICATASGFFVSLVLHKAIMEVDEEGTVAAAVAPAPAPTGPAKSPPPPIMRVDRPFLVFIEDTKSGLLLFSGIVRDPQSAH